MNHPRVVVVGYHAAELLDIACVTSSLTMANVHGATPPYEVCLATPSGAPITCAGGMALQGHQALERVTGPLDTLVVSGGLGHEEAATNRLITGHVRRLARESRRVASVCTGASVLAAAGLLDGRRVTTHWQFAHALAAHHPEIAVNADPIFIRDGNIATAAGITSALDLTLAFIQEDHGTTLARNVARALVTYLQRPGNQAQMSMFTQGPPPGDAVISQVLDHINSNLNADLTTATLAAAAGVSERHLTRLFLKHLGWPPGRYVRRTRTEAAAHLLSSTTLPMTAIATRCGFGTAETLRQAFVDRYGIPPSHYRRTQTST